MATLALTNAFAYLDAHDFTGDTDSWSLSGEATTPECTNHRSGGWREYKIGVKSSRFEMSGHYQTASSDSVDSELFPNIGAGGRVVTTGPVETEGGVACIHRAMAPTYEWLGSHGEITPFKMTAVGADGPTGVARGQLAVAKTTVTSTGAKGTALNLGLVGAGQYLYATLHLLGTAGTSITAVVESDEDNNWSSATTRITFGPLTAVGGNWGTRVAGAIADDDWFRLRVTAITGTWSIACAIAIGY